MATCDAQLDESATPVPEVGSATTVTRHQVDVLVVAGDVDGSGLAKLRRELTGLAEVGTRFLVVDLSAVVECDARLFTLLSRTDSVLRVRGGWLRLTGLGPAMLDALEHAPLPAVLLLYRASRAGGVPELLPRAGEVG